VGQTFLKLHFKKFNSNFNFRRISNVTHRIEAATRRSIGTPNHGIEESLGEPEVEAFCLSVSALQQLMASERVIISFLKLSIWIN